MLCEKCHQESYSIYINAKHQKICAACSDEEKREMEELREKISGAEEIKSST